MSFPTVQDILAWDINFDVVAIDLELFAYMGFDPKHTLKKLAEKATNQKFSKERFKQDMMRILTFYVSRGTRLYTEKVRGKTREEAKDILRDLASAYNVQDKQPKSRDDITVARIVAVFPHIVAELMNNETIGRVVGNAPAGFFRCLCFPSAPSIIPRLPAYEPVYESWLVWAKEFDKVINQKNADIKKVEQYGEITWKSNYLTNDERVRIMSRLGIRL